MIFRRSTQWLALLVAGGALASLVDLTTAAAASDTPQAAGQATDRHAASGKGQDAKGQLPQGGRQIFRHRVLVAYYGTAHTGALGVLGETDPATMTKRLRDAARPFGAGGDKVQIVYELIVSIADAEPGADGDYSHFIPTNYVEEYVRAARRNNALLVLDLQPGRSDFLSQAKHFRWALREPFVGLALDPEWRMGRHEIPGQTIGSVNAAEVNRVSQYVTRLTHRDDLPQKLFMLHAFRTDMIHHINQVRPHKALAMVQHVDGFGTHDQKLATYHAVARPEQFHMGFKLFYDEDTDLFRPREVLKIRPQVRFISYQ